jgi:hypothetical protein
MSFLNRLEDWLIRQTLQPPLETHPALPEKPDEVPVLLTLLIVALLGTAVTCGHYLAQ